MLTLEDRITARLRSTDYQRWRGRVEAVGACLRPVHLSGYRITTDKTTGRILDRAAGEILAPCGNRRETVCPACSDRYAADAFHLLRAGLSGGKGIPDTVAGKPRFFLTLTAPGFGPVHTNRTTTSGKRIPCGCGSFHHPADPRLGHPTDPATYDYTRAVLWQGHAGELWHRFTIRLRRELAGRTGIRVKDFRHHARISYAKVAEYQKRGLIHFHAVVRIDGPEGPHDPAPPWATPELIETAIRAAAETTEVTKTLPVDGRDQDFAFTWGQQLDIRQIRPADADQLEDTHGEITDQALAGYIAKYATKGTSTSDMAERPLRSELDIEVLRIAEHHKQMMRTAWDLGAAEDLRYLRKWAHMLGFRGHFLTKSQRYSITFRLIRGERRAWQQHAALERLGTDTSSVVVINHWNHVGNGYATDAEREIAAAIYERKRQHRKQQHDKETTP